MHILQDLHYTNWNWKKINLLSYFINDTRPLWAGIVYIVFLFLRSQILAELSALAVATWNLNIRLLKINIKRWYNSKII